MRQSSFIALVTTGLLVSGLTWAGPPESESQKPEIPYEEEMSEDVSDEMTVIEEPEILSFEDAVEACKEAEELQACIDLKTGRIEELTETPIDSEVPVSEDPVPENPAEEDDEETGWNPE